jgi:ABC-type multidrug transport system ATPase subunit
MSIAIKNLSKRFSVSGFRKEVLKSVDLDVKPGEVFHLSGPNGSGKTTLLKIIATLLSPSRGRVLINDVDIALEPEATKKQIGFIYDFEKNFYQVLSLQKNMEFYGRLFGLTGSGLESRVEQMIDQFSLSEYRHLKIYQCSSGIKQKIVFARALLPDPSVILIDEFSKSLDDASRSAIAVYLKRLVRKDKKTCVIVSHDKELAARIADRTGRLEDGVLRCD